MTDTKSIRYFPLTETIFFIVTSTLTFVVADKFDLTFWLPTVLTMFSYLFFLAGANVISLTSDKIQITFLNLFGGQVSVDLNKITKIWSTETYEQETALDMESIYYEFKRHYNLEYLDKKNVKRQTYFKISNRKKEKEILTIIKSQQLSDVYAKQPLL